jgi:hypothetical protein
MIVLRLNQPIHKPGSRQVRSLFARNWFLSLRSGSKEFCLMAKTARIFTKLTCRVKQDCDLRFHQAADSLEPPPETPFKNT